MPANVRVMSTDTRNRILDATDTLLCRDSGPLFRVSDVANIADVSRQAVYNHFPTRADILIAASRRVHESESGPECQTGPALNRLRTLVGWRARALERTQHIDRALGCAAQSDVRALQVCIARDAGLRAQCRLMVVALYRADLLSVEWCISTGADVLSALLSRGNWDHLTIDLGWTSEEFVRRISRQVIATLVKRICDPHVMPLQLPPDQRKDAATDSSLAP